MFVNIILMKNGHVKIIYVIFKVWSLGLPN